MASSISVKFFSKPQIILLLRTTALLAVPLLFFGSAVVWPISLIIKIVIVSMFKGNDLLAYFPKAILYLTFTVKQAGLSSLLTMLFSLPLAYLFSHYNFIGKKLLLSLSLLPFALPSIVVVFAFVVVYGNNGFFTVILHNLGINVQFLYRIEAIVAAHVFFNLPFATRLLTERFLSLPREYHVSMQAMLLSPRKAFLWVKFPYVFKTWINLGILTFSLCLTSFAIILILGGNPNMTSLEVGIFRSLRYDYDLRATAIFSLFQMALSCFVIIAYKLTETRASLHTRIFEGTQTTTNKQSTPHWGKILIWAFFLFLIMPLFGLTTDFIKATFHYSKNPLSTEIYDSAVHSSILSIGVALLSSLLSVSISLLFCKGVIVFEKISQSGSKLLKASTWLFFGLSPTVLGFAWYLSLQMWFSPFDLPFVPIFFVHTVLSLPFAIRIILPNLEQVSANVEPIAKSISLNFWFTFFRIEIPLIKKNLYSALGLAFAFSFGEVAVASLFSSGSNETLPVLISRLMGVYHFTDATILSFILAGLCGVIFVMSERYSK